MLNPNLSLVPMRGVQAQGQSIRDIFDTYYRAQDNTRQNALFDLNRHQAALREQVIKDQEARAAEAHAAQMKAANLKYTQEQGRQLYQAIDALEGLPTPVKMAEIERLAPGLKELDFDDDDLAILATEEGVPMAKQILSQYAPQAPEELKVGRYREKTLPDGTVISHDTATDQTRVIYEGEDIDLSVVPEEAREGVAKLPVEIQKKVVNEYASPKGQNAVKDEQSKQAKAQQVADKTLSLVNELLANIEGVKSSVGPLDELFPSVSDSARDADAALADLRNLLTVENLGIMSGVLSESDIKIIQSVGASGLSGSQDRVIGTLHKLQKALSGEGSQIDDLVNKYAN